MFFQFFANSSKNPSTIVLLTFFEFYNPKIKK